MGQHWGIDHCRRVVYNQDYCIVSNSAMGSRLMLEQISTFFDRIKMGGNSKAHPNSIVICGQARFTILTSRLIRLEWSATGKFEDRATFAFPGRYAEPPAFQRQLNGTQTEINTGD